MQLFGRIFSSSPVIYNVKNGTSGVYSPSSFTAPYNRFFRHCRPLYSTSSLDTRHTPALRNPVPRQSPAVL